MLGVSKRNTKFGKAKGFTLIEMLVVMALFTLLGVVIVDVFILTLGAQRLTNNRQTALNGLRFSVQSMASQIRISQVDFEPPIGSGLSPAYELDGDVGIQGFEDELYLTGPDGFTYHYFSLDSSLWLEVSGVCLSNDKCSFDQSDCLATPTGNACGNVSAPLINRQDLKVDKLTFFITPAVNPFIEEQCNLNSECSDFGPAEGCSICPAGPSVECDGSEVGIGFCRCMQPGDCQVTQHCDIPDMETVGLCAPNNLQPMVTINIGFTSEGNASDEQQSLQMQTTVVSRVYRR